jgi:hypothetical protein
VLSAELAAVAERLNLFPEVAWDRCVTWPGGGWAFGWLQRQDGRSDFATLNWWWEEADVEGSPLTCAVGTSSAAYSADFSARLHATGHVDCKRVEHVFEDAVQGAIRLPAEPQCPHRRVHPLSAAWYVQCELRAGHDPVPGYAWLSHQQGTLVWDERSAWALPPLGAT